MEGKKLLIGLGPARSGTTWIYELLYGHSQVATTRRKEVNFFNLHYDKGLQWYQAQFLPPSANTKLFADISPFYISDSRVVERIKETGIQPIFIVGMRSPYDRVLSWYYRYIHENHSVLALVEDGDLRADAIKIGTMAPGLEKFITHFQGCNFIFLDYQDLRRDSIQTARTLQQALELDMEIPLSVRNQINASLHSRLPKRVRRTASYVSAGIRRHFPRQFYSLKFGLFLKLIYDSRRPISATFAEDVFVAMRSFEDIFEADITRLERVLGQDLTAWRFHSNR